jgi:drug/metabolite transporter (DMT)-like permease
MLTWLIVIILAYFFFSLSYLGDKLILSGPPKPNSYTFYVGVISIFVVAFIPFIKFGLPDGKVIFWIVAEAIAYILGLYTMFFAIEKFDVSRVMTTIGATQPVFIFILAWIIFGPQKISSADILAFVLLILGSTLISFEKKSKLTGSYLKITIIASLLFSLDYIFSKIVFMNAGFLQGFIWMRIFVFLFALLFLIGKNNRQEIFKKQNILNKKTGTIFIFTHASGGIANILQGFAIFLAPIAILPIVNSLRGIQYVFLFLITLFLSVFFPKILKEEISKKILAQKIISIVLIAAGLAILVIY